VPPFRQGERTQGLYGVVVVTRISQQRPVYVEGHWHINVTPWGIHIPPFWQGFGWHGVVAKKDFQLRKTSFFSRKNCLPGASQRLPVNVAGQWQINPAPFVTHWPPLRPKYE